MMCLLVYGCSDKENNEDIKKCNIAFEVLTLCIGQLINTTDQEKKLENIQLCRDMHMQFPNNEWWNRLVTQEKKMKLNEFTTEMQPELEQCTTKPPEEITVCFLNILKTTANKQKQIICN